MSIENLGTEVKSEFLEAALSYAQRGDLDQWVQKNVHVPERQRAQ